MNAPDSSRNAARPAGQSGLEAQDPLWYQDAVIYQLHVKAFFDSNDDGIGDFRGLTSKLDYVRELGVNTLWLLPFYPSPLKDDGYDVADYRAVHPDYGSTADLRAFVREAHRRGLRVVTELVVNHTSDQHPWFQAARRAPRGSRKRNWYVWSDTDTKYAGTRIIFTDTETSNWAWDPVAQQYYWHRFFSHQPDLNFDNPSVLKAVFRTMRYWLDMGVDGFRLDAVPYLIEREGTGNENLPETHAVLRQIRALMDESYPNRMLLAEANMWPEDVRPYFGDGDECHMAYHFPLMPRIYMAIAQEDRHPVVEIMQQTPEIPESCQWAIFLRNHDELTLEMVTSKERDYMYRMYAVDARARINLGIRRRLAPLMENDADRIKLMNSLLLSMPGSPIIYYGDEIGMGDNFFLGDRNGVRTPMQWSPDRNAGFSRADPQRLYLPPIMDPIYGYEAVNVEAQARDPSSLLNWTRRILAVRKTSRAFGRGRLSFLRPGNRKVLAYIREIGEGPGSEAVLCVANLGRSAQPVELDLARYRGRVPVEMTGRTPFPPIGELPYLLTLPAHGFYWFRLATDAEVPSWHEERLVVREELPVVVLFDGWMSFFRERVVPWRIAMAERTRRQLEEEVLPNYIEQQRWYGAKGRAIRRARLEDQLLWELEGGARLVGLYCMEHDGEGVDSAGAVGDSARAVAVYFVPLALAWENGDEERARALEPAALAKVRQQSSVGFLSDAFADPVFCRAIVAAIGERRSLATARGTLAFEPTRAFATEAREPLESLPVRRPQSQGSNTVVAFGDRMFLKVYRHARPGVNVELEVGRFLTEVARFPHCAPVTGSVEYRTGKREPTTLALLQTYVPNQGDGWSYTLSYLQRELEERRTRLPGAKVLEEALAREPHGAYLARIQTLGQRTAELHRAFQASAGDPAFEPEPQTEADVAGWAESVRGEALATLDKLARARERLDERSRAAADRLLAQREALLERAANVPAPPGDWRRSRYHGDYHLGQVLVVRDDWLITDFEGEPARPLEARRRKHSPLRDVAGMLRSFAYARASALRELLAVPAAPENVRQAAAEWEQLARGRFLDAYAQGIRGAPGFGDFARARPLVALFELEKALYELRYELDNRPGWAAIPLSGILGLLGAEVEMPEDQP